MVALKADLADLVLRALVDHEDQVRMALAAGGLDAVGDRHVRVAVSLVVFLQIAAGFEDFRVTHHSAGFELGFLGQLLVGKHGVADEAHAVPDRAGGHFGDEFHAVSRRLREEAHIIHQAGLVKGRDVLVEILGPVGRARLRGHLVAQEVFVDRLRPAVTDLHI